MNRENTAAVGTASSRETSRDDVWRVNSMAYVTLAIGLLSTLLFAVAAGATASARTALFAGGMLVASAFAVIGGMIGFLFAIPRSRQEQRAVSVIGSDSEGAPQRLSDYAANTNLEQISDWLTKILVGVTLVELKDFPQRFGAFGTTLAPLLGGGPTSRPATLALMTFFTMWGFFFAYLITRLWLPKALTRAEREEEVRKREIEQEAELRAVERSTYDNLYQGPPGGFLRAIEAVETYHSKPGALRSAWLWMYLAAAYGQQHAWALAAKKQAQADGATDQAERYDAEARLAQERVIPAVQEALRLNPGTRPILEQLYRGHDPNENDLASLKGDPQLDKLLGERQS